jgi:hypothetical protein
VGGGRQEGEVAQTMYTHVSKCKNDKMKERRKRKKERKERVHCMHVWKVHKETHYKFLQ